MGYHPPAGTGGGGGGAPASHHASHETGGTDALAALSASILTSGTLPDARLSSDVARNSALGLWTPVTFSAANFAGTGAMVWTVAAGNVTTNRYMVLGKTLFWQCIVSSSGLSGTPGTTLKVTVPGGLVIPSFAFAVGKGFNAASLPLAVEGSGVQLNVLRMDGLNYACPDATFYCYINLVCEVL